MPEGSENPCMDCGGICCSFQSMNICWRTLEGDDTFDEAIDNLDVSNLVAEDGEVLDMEFYVDDVPGGRIFFHCNHREDGLCTVYDRRPEMCSAFECPVLKGDETVADLKQYAGRHPSDSVPSKDELRDVTDEMHARIAKVSP